jgi:unsaturated rhamnogalacturonyl hydrolase
MKKNIIRSWAVILTALTLGPAPVSAAQPSEFGGATPLQWSVRMADSETHRLGDSRAWRPGRRVKWDYTSGLFTLSLLRLNEAVPTPRYVDFTKDTIGSFITPDGNIQGYKITDYNIDNVAPGKTVLALYQLTQEERYQKNADLLRRQLQEQPRTSEGGFWHKQRYPWQMWLDGLFMGAPFYAEYVKMFNGPASDYDDIVKQYRLMDRAAYDPKTGLYWHAWDEKKQQNWANPTTGLSSNFWGRAVGWWAMAQVDVLDFLPENHSGRAEIISIIKKTADGVVKWQDAETGVWWQVLDQGTRKGNYREATCSAMFVYSMAKAVNRGYLSRDYVPAILKGYEGIIKHFIKTDGAGLVSLTSCCSVAGLSADRDGSYEYYLREPLIDNDLKGVGPFILAGIEMQKLLQLPLVAQTDIKVVIEKKTSVAKEWEQMPDILARISAPLIPGHRFSILDYGAVGDGKTDSSAAITKAIADAVKHGGGRVIVPPGDYVTGPIHLKSKINLHVEKGATLLFKTDPAAYLPLVFTRWEGMECWNYSPLIYAIDAEHIAVTGEGVLDGQADMTNWWPWKGRWKGRDLNPPGTPTQQAARDRLVEMVANNVPVSERRFGEGGYLRPSFIQPYRCKNVLIEGVSIRRSPMWEIHPVLSTNVIVRGVNILTHGPNNDGCNPESCRDVLIEDTVFDTGDDCIAIKSGRNNDGRRIGVPSENIIIRRNQMKQGHGGVTLGSEISGGARNVFVEDCVMDSPSLDRAIRFKSNAARGGITENIFVRNITIGTVADAVLQIDFMYEEGPNGDFPPAVRNLVMENINVGKARRVLDIRGFPAAEISGVRFYNSTIKGITQNDSVKDGDVKLVDCVVERQQ